VATLKGDDAPATALLDKLLIAAARDAADGTSDTAFRKLVPHVAAARRASFTEAMRLLQQYMDTVGGLLATRWDDERYVRELEDVDDDVEQPE
jgi:hypothetical protein